LGVFDHHRRLFHCFILSSVRELCSLPQSSNRIQPGFGRFSWFNGILHISALAIQIYLYVWLRWEGTGKTFGASWEAAVDGVLGGPGKVCGDAAAGGASGRRSAAGRRQVTRKRLDRIAKPCGLRREGGVWGMGIQEEDKKKRSRGEDTKESLSVERGLERVFVF